MMAVRAATIGVLLVAAAVTVWLFADVDARHIFAGYTRDPVLGPLVAVLIVAGLVCVLVPRTALAIAGGLVFGPLLGSVYVLVGLALGAIVGFEVGRWLGRDALAGSRFLRLVDR